MLSSQLQSQGVNFKNTLSQLLRTLHKITVMQLTGAKSKTTYLNDLAAQWSAEEVQLYYEIILRGQQDIDIAPSRHLGFEMTLLRLIAFSPSDNKTNNNTKKISTLSHQKKQRTIQPEKQAIDSNSSDYWVDLLSKLTLPGATNAVAQSCALESYSENEIKLIIAPSYEALLAQKHIDRIQQAAESVLKRKITLSINVGESKQPSAQATSEKKKQQRMSEVENNLRNDQNVKGILNTFNATIITETINEKLEEVK